MKRRMTDKQRRAMFAKSRNKNLTLKTRKNLKMDNKVYLLRRKVIDIIYDTKKMTDLPRIDVRITETDRVRPTILGTADFNHFTIWIPKRTLDMYSDKDVRQIVLHEIAHTVFKKRHVDNEKSLMNPTFVPMSKTEMDRQFKRLTRGD